MKKLAILFLLTTVLVTFSFAQSITADFSVDNVAKGNDGEMDPTLALKFAGSGSKELGPGAINLAGELQYKMSFGKDAASSTYAIGDNNFRIGYALPAGPGTLGFGVKFADTFTTTEFDVGYDGIAAGPATIGFGGWYALKTTGVNDSAEKAPFGKGGIDDDEVGFRVSASFDFNLGITYKFVYGLGKSEIAKIAYLDITYTGVDKFTFGLEVDDTGKEFKGFTLKPYANYAVREDLTAGVYVKLTKINAAAGDIEFTPGLFVTYSFD